MALEEEELLLKQLPHSVEAEQAVLGSMLIDPRCVPDVIEQLRPEDFYIRQNREIYETIYSMFNFSLTIDPVTHRQRSNIQQYNTLDFICQTCTLYSSTHSNYLIRIYTFRRNFTEEILNQFLYSRYT